MSVVTSEKVRLLVKRANPRIDQRLLTAELCRKFPMLRGQQGQGDQACVYLKLFGSGRWTWYATEAAAVIAGEEPVEKPLRDVVPEDDLLDVMFFGYVVSGLGSDCDEYCYFTLMQLASPDMAFPPFGLPIERDAHFDQQPLAIELRERWGKTALPTG